MQFYILEKERILAELDLMIDETNEDAKRRLEANTMAIAAMIKPKEFDEYKNFEIAYETNFERTCIILAKHSTQDIKELTVKEFFALVDHVNEIKKQNA